jgi:hypothetical protein
MTFKPRPWFRREGYDGYLKPHVPEIVALWKMGEPFAEIARRMKDHFPNPRYGPSADMIRYVLARTGHLPKRVPPEHTPEVPPRRYIVNWETTFPIRSLGRPIDMGGPRDVWIEADPWSDL